jgi:hypothetical protein
MRSGELPVAEAKASLRRHVLEMVRAAEGMQELWFACLDNLDDTLRAEMDAESSRQGFLDHFLWDWFKKYSEARPIARAARFFEPTDLRLANHLDSWGLVSWEPWEVVGRQREAWKLRQLGSHREIEVHRAFDHHVWKVGDAILTRILHHGGHDFSGLSVSRFTGAAGVRTLESHWLRLAKKHGFAPSTRLRPDIHNDIWLALHEDLLGCGLTPVPELAATESPFFDLPQSALGGATPRQAAQHEFGRHKLNAWAKNLEASERKLVEELLARNLRPSSP